MAENDVYQVLQSWVGLGVRGANVYYYQSKLPAGLDAQVLASNFRAHITPEWNNIVSSQTVWDEIQVRNLFNPADIGYELAFTESGTRGAECHARFVAWSFFTPRVVGNIRRGRKRIGMIAENDVSNNVAVTGAIRDNLQAFAGVLGDSIFIAAVLSFTPVVVKRIPYTVGGKVRYRLPENQGELVKFDAEDWAYQVNVTSQVSRRV